MEISPTPSNVEIGGVPAPAVAGGAAAIVAESIEPNNTQITVPSGALYDTAANPLVLSPLGPGALVTVVNFRAVSIKVRSANPADPGVIIPALTTQQFGFDPIGAGGGFINLIGGGPSGTSGNSTYSVATLAARPALTAVPNGTWVYVQSQKSWYWSGTDLAGNPAWLRLVAPNDVWMAQTAWGIDSVAGNDENVGSVASPLKTFAELSSRLPTINRSTTVTIAAGSAFGVNDWLGWSLRPVAGVQAAAPSMTFVGVRTLGADHAVVSSSNEAGNTPPLIDAGIALTIGQIVQATSGASNGATAVVTAFVAGTQFQTTPWMIGGFTRTTPPAPADNIAQVALPSIAKCAFSNTLTLTVYQDLAFASIFQSTVSGTQIFRTCTIAGLLNGTNSISYAFQGSALNVSGGFQFQNFKGTFNGCGIFPGGNSVLIESATSIFLTDSILETPGQVTVSNNGLLEANSLGIISCNGTFTLRIVRGGVLRVRGTLYGSGNAGIGTSVAIAGCAVVQAGQPTPTLAATGQELQLDGGATAIPPLTPGAAVPANWPANALTTWAQWNGAPFNRQVMSYMSGASINQE